LLYRKENKIPVLLSGDDADIFRRHIELFNSKPDETLTERMERTIEIHLRFIENPCPIPQFIE
jgi:hypothetical protein